MSDSNGAEGSNTVDFSELSLELRDQIYRELLYQPIGYGAARRRHKFETSILRVNKQIHQEASRVLYEENAWVVFEMRCQGMMEWLALQADHYVTVTSRDVTRYGILAFGGNPSLRVRVQERRLQHPEIIHYLIIPLEWVGDMTKFLIPGDMSHDCEFAVDFNGNQKQESRQRMAIEFLEVLRGVKQAKITGLSPPSLGAQLVKHMKTRITSIDELIDRTSVYIRRAERMLRQGQLYLAEELYNQGFDNSISATGSDSIANFTPAKGTMFNSKLYESLEGSAVCSLRHGNSLPACKKLKLYVMKTGDLPDSQRATGLYYYGLASLAAGFDNQALYGFVLALILIPGHEAADKEVDALDERVTKGMSPKTVMASILSNKDVEDMERYRLCLNLDLVKPCRHRNASDGELSLWQKHDLMTNFD